jgi:predicted DNA-binding transcriptional regulator AlpA
MNLTGIALATSRGGGASLREGLGDGLDVMLAGMHGPDEPPRHRSPERETELLGCGEVALVCGVDEGTIVHYVRAGRMPQPYARVSTGPIWLGGQIRAWLDRIEPLGVGEVSRLLGVHDTTLKNWRRRGRFPEPYATLACGPIWLRTQIEEWRPNVFTTGKGRWPALPVQSSGSRRPTFRPRVLQGEATIRRAVLTLRSQGLVPTAIADKLRISDRKVAEHLAMQKRAERLARLGLDRADIARTMRLHEDALSDYLRATF